MSVDQNQRDTKSLRIEDFIRMTIFIITLFAQPRLKSHKQKHFRGPPKIHPKVPPKSAPQNCPPKFPPTTCSHVSFDMLVLVLDFLASFAHILFLGFRL